MRSNALKPPWPECAPTPRSWSGLQVHMRHLSPGPPWARLVQAQTCLVGTVEGCSCHGLRPVQSRVGQCRRPALLVQRHFSAGLKPCLEHPPSAGVPAGQGPSATQSQLVGNTQPCTTRGLRPAMFLTVRRLRPPALVHHRFRPVSNAVHDLPPKLGARRSNTLPSSTSRRNPAHCNLLPATPRYAGFSQRCGE